MTTLITLLAAAALVYLVVEHGHLTRALARRPPDAPTPPRYPALTVIRPIRGLDVGADDNVRALLDSDYPGPLELLFVFDDDADPAGPVVRELVATRPDVDARVLIAGPPPDGRTGKLHAMSVGVRAAKGELIGFSDSDTRVDRDLLRVLVERLLATDGAGDVFAPALADAPPHTAGDVGYALMLNVWYGALAATAAGAARELPFIMGQIMIFRREALAAIGGVESADGQLVDDMYLGKRMADAGWHNVMSDRPLHIVTGDMSLGDFVRLMRRWLLFSRSGLPSQFKRPAWLRGVAMWAAMIAAAAAIAGGLPLATVLAVAALAAACLSDRALHRQLGGAPIPLRFFPMTLAVMLLAPWVLASMLVDRHVDWRGRDYALDNGSHLKNDSSAALPRG
jgi:ceramide glucosyltransferase